MSRKQVIVLGLIGIAVVAALATGGFFVTESWEDSENGQKWAPTLAAAESRYGIPTGLLSRIAYQESSFETNVINGTEPSSAGALGMMQLEPEYFSTVQVPVPFTDADTTAQIQQAAQLLASLYSTFGNWTAATAAYNAGQGTISAVLAGSETLPTETANYIASISQSLPSIVSPTLQGAPSGSTMVAQTGDTQPGTTTPGATGGTQAG
jgi:soluble lytic murein transglycosylase-like protein